MYTSDPFRIYISISKVYSDFFLILGRGIVKISFRTFKLGKISVILFCIIKVYCIAISKVFYNSNIQRNLSIMLRLRIAVLRFTLKTMGVEFPLSYQLLRLLITKTSEKKDQYV